MKFSLGEKVKTQVKIEVKKYDRKRRLARVGIDEVEGIVVGSRTMREGITEDWGDGAIEFKPTKYLKVFLVALTMNHMIRVLPEDLRKTK